jgi:hypothetical protein
MLQNYRNKGYVVEARIYLILGRKESITVKKINKNDNTLLRMSNYLPFYNHYCIVLRSFESIPEK